MLDLVLQVVAARLEELPELLQEVEQVPVELVHDELPASVAGAEGVEPVREPTGAPLLVAPEDADAVEGVVVALELQLSLRVLDDEHGAVRVLAAAAAVAGAGEEALDAPGEAPLSGVVVAGGRLQLLSFQGRNKLG